MFSPKKPKISKKDLKQSIVKTNDRLKAINDRMDADIKAKKSELKSLSADETDVTSTYIVADNPAKKIVLYVEPTITGVSSLQVDDVLTMTLNGETAANKKIKIDPNDLPFTLTGILLTSFTIQSATGTTAESVALISFH